MPSRCDYCGVRLVSVHKVIRFQHEKICEIKKIQENIGPKVRVQLTKTF